MSASAIVRDEWRARIAAEYTSAAVSNNLVQWLIQAGAPPDLLDAGLAIVGDELVHARLSHEVYVAAGGDRPPAIEPETLVLARACDHLLDDVLDVAVRVFCLGETVAVPLFVHLRARCTVETARVALDRIVVDEVRHRDFGWDLLDWLQLGPDGARLGARAQSRLPAYMAGLAASYGEGNPIVRADAGAMSEDDRAWGLAPAREYAEVLAASVERDLIPRFAARGLAL